MKSSILTFSLILALSISSFGRRVETWVPVYGIDNCKAILNDATKSQWIKNGVTHIGLQFWVPGDNGAVVFLSDYQFQWKAATIGQDVQDFVTWGNANNVKIELCFFNVHDNDFDWTYTQNVINNYPNETVASIMTIINNYNLDGVDIDFEGVGDYAADKPAFVNFLDTLGKALHASNKELSVDMFSTPCYNYPNPTWESAMAPKIDFMNIMGYTDTYENNNTLFGYCPGAPSESHTYPFRYSYIENYLTFKQGVASSKLNYGLPSWVDNWGGQCAQKNILDLTYISSQGGIAIWDMQLDAGGVWLDPVTWDLIAMFKNDSTSSQIRSHVVICGGLTAINKAEEQSKVYYDSYNREVKLSGMEGELFLYSTLGRLEKSWKVNAGENVSLDGIENGFYIIRFENKNGLYSERVSLFK